MRFLQILTIAAMGVLPTALADTKDDEEKAKKEFREAEGEKKKEKGAKEGQLPQGQGMEDPLEALNKILELMDKVETNLYESNTGEFTQDEQKQIVEAMRFEEKTHEALEELIRKIEEQAQEQQSSSSSSSSEQQKKQQQQQQDQKNQQNQNESEQERQQRLQREKREEQQRQARQKQQQQQQQQNQQQKPQNGQEDKQQQQGAESKPPEDDTNPLNEKDRAGGRWGNLPKKLHQDAGRASEREAPDRWRKYYERYTEKLSDKPSKK